MSTDTDILIERRRSRRQSLVWKVVAALAVTSVVAMFISNDPAQPQATGDMTIGMSGFGSKFGMMGGTTTEATGKRIARINVEGIILEDRYRAKLIESLKDDGDVKAVIVYINSPGGAVVGGENLYRNLRNLGETKPVVAIMGSLAASAGYMTAIAAERIYAREGTLTGSIGVLFEATEVTGLLKKIGVKSELVKSAPLKAQPNPMEPFTAAGRAAIKSVVMDMYDMFVTMVTDRRPLSREQVLTLADGRIFTGRQALKNGLIDAIGGEKEAISWLETEKGIAANLPVVEVAPKYPRPAFLKRLMGAVMGSVGKTLVSERLTLDGLLAVWHPKM